MQMRNVYENEPEMTVSLSRGYCLIKNLDQNRAFNFLISFIIEPIDFKFRWMILDRPILNDNKSISILWPRSVEVRKMQLEYSDTFSHKKRMRIWYENDTEMAVIPNLGY